MFALDNSVLLGADQGRQMSNAPEEITQARIDQKQARLDEHLTRREVVEAIEVIAKDYGADGSRRRNDT